jgi:hypothetical protein
MIKKIIKIENDDKNHHFKIDGFLILQAQSWKTQRFPLASPQSL